MNEKNNNSTKTAARETKVSLLSQLGGQKSLNALVGAFYFNLLRDERLSRFFLDTDVDALRRHQQQFLAAALDESHSYSGRRLSEAHRQLIQRDGLNEIHFNAMTAVLAASISEFGHPADLRDAIVERVRAIAKEILDLNSNPEKPKE